MRAGRGRFEQAGAAFLSLVQSELRASERPHAPGDVARLLDLTEDELWARLDRADRAGLDALVARWNARAEHHAVARMVLVDRGDECEILLGRAAWRDPGRRGFAGA